MMDPKWFFEQLLTHKIEFYTGVPDSLLKNVCSYINDHTIPENHIIAANEGCAMAIG